jgi:hypothetical protein
MALSFPKDKQIIDNLYNKEGTIKFSDILFKDGKFSKPKS